MTHEESKKLLNDYFDEKLSLEVNTEIQVHLSECDECSQYLFSLQALMKKSDQLPRSIKPPADFWHDIFVSLSDIKTETLKQKEEVDSEEVARLAAETEEQQKQREDKAKAEKLLAWEQKKAKLVHSLKSPRVKQVLIGVAALVLIFIIYTLFLAKGKAWEVRKIVPGSFGKSEAYATLSEKEILQANSATKLEIHIPEIGIIIVEPETKIERLPANKIRLLQGTISKTPSGDVKKFLTVDAAGVEFKEYYLGSRFKISLNESNKAFLNVEDSWMSVKDNNYETMVLPNHFMLLTATQTGLPYRKGSADKLLNAIDAYCFNDPGNEESLIAILTNSELANLVTVWNLMPRVTRKQRDMVVYTMLGLLGETPQGVTEDGLKTLDSGMLFKLLEEIELRIQ